MKVISGKSIPWILASVAMLAIVGVVLAGAMWPDGSSQATTAVPRDTLTESLSAVNPVDASLAPAAPEFATVMQDDGGEPAVSGQQSRTPANISISPEEDWNPVKTQHTFTVTVTDAGNAPVSGAEVELILNRFSGAIDADGKTIFSVGDIVSIDNGEKVDNTFGKVTTNAAGQATFTITSTREGDTDVTAYAPGIADADNHKVFAVKHWIDKDVVCPPSMATNQAGTSHEMTITVFRASSGMDVDGYPAAPLEGETVAWRITENDPAATLTQMETTTDSLGEATVTLNQVNPAPGDNTVTISVVDADNRPMFNCTVVKQWIAGQLGVTKTASADTVNIGETVIFTIDVQNLNQAGDLTGVNVTDTFPFDGFETNDATAWEGLTLVAGETRPFTITATAIATGTFTNEVSATSTEDAGPASDDATVTVVAPDVTVSKRVEPEEILVGETATYTITVTNNSQTAAANNILITDESDPGLTQTSSNLASTIEQLAPGASETYTVAVMGTQAGVFTNVVSVDWDERGPSGYNEPSDSATLRVLQPEIEIEKTGRGALFTGRAGTYTLTVINTGDAPLTGVVITDTIPSGMSYVSSDNNGSINGNVVTWNVGNLAVDEVRSVSVTLRGDDAGTHTNRADVATDEGATDSGTFNITVTPAAGADIDIVDDPDPALVGDTVIFTVTVDNQGSTAPMTNVLVTVILDDKFSIQDSGGGSISGNEITFTLATLGAGQSHDYIIRVEAVAEGAAQTKATLNYDEFPLEDSKTQGTTIIAQ